MENISNPFYALEQFLSNPSKVNNLRDTFIKDIIENINGNIESVDAEKGIIKFSHFFDGEKTIDIIFDFDTELEILLCKQIQIVQNKIDNGFLQNIQFQKEYFEFLRKHINSFFSSSVNTVILYPVVKKYLILLTAYINEKYSLCEDSRIYYTAPVETDPNATSQDGEIQNSHSANIIESVLGYLKLENDQGEIIMSKLHYDKMVSQILFFLEHRREPDTIIKLPTVKIPKNLLRFSFKVLHFELFKTKTKNREFILLISKLFSDFDDWDFTNFYSKFSNRDAITIKNYIPEIIKKHLEN